MTCTQTDSRQLDPIPVPSPRLFAERTRFSNHAIAAAGAISSNSLSKTVLRPIRAARLQDGLLLDAG
jgi:hypothetical protein